MTASGDTLPDSAAIVIAGGGIIGSFTATAITAEVRAAIRAEPA